MKTLGIIGFGRMGQLLVRHLRSDFKIKVSDKFLTHNQILDSGYTPGTNTEVAKLDIVIICVPVRYFEKLIIEIKDHVKRGALVLDMCSVKDYPKKIMLKHLSDDISLLGTHPMFGPDSAKFSVEGKKIILTPIRVSSIILDQVKSYLNQKKLNIIIASSKDHDFQMGQSLLLTHIIGRALIEFGAKNVEIDTDGYIQLMKILKTVQNDSIELYEDMNHYNKYAQEIRNHFKLSLEKVTKGFDP